MLHADFITSDSFATHIGVITNIFRLTGLELLSLLMSCVNHGPVRSTTKLCTDVGAALKDSDMTTMILPVIPLVVAAMIKGVTTMIIVVIVSTGLVVGMTANVSVMGATNMKIGNFVLFVVHLCPLSMIDQEDRIMTP